MTLIVRKRCEMPQGKRRWLLVRTTRVKPPAHQPAAADARDETGATHVWRYHSWSLNWVKMRSASSRKVATMRNLAAERRGRDRKEVVQVGGRGKRERAGRAGERRSKRSTWLFSRARRFPARWSSPWSRPLSGLGQSKLSEAAGAALGW